MTQIIFNDYDINKIIFSEPIDSIIPNSDIRYKRINISTNNDDGSVGDLVIPIKSFSYGIEEQIDPEDRKIVACTLPIVLFDQNGSQNDDQKRFITIFDKIIEECKSNLISNKEKFGMSDLEYRDLKRLNPIHYKHNRGIVDPHRATLYTKLLYSKRFNKITTPILDQNDNLVDPITLKHKHFHGNFFVKIDSIFIKKNISIQVKLIQCKLNIEPTSINLDGREYQVITLNNDFQNQVAKINNYKDAYARLCDATGDVVKNFPWDIAPTIVAGGASLYAVDSTILDFGDIDFWAYDLKNFDHLILWIEKALHHFNKLGYIIDYTSKKHPIITQNAVTLLHENPLYKTVQLVYRWSPATNVKELLNRFDISCVRVGIDNNKMYYGTDALDNIYNHQVIFDTKHELYDPFITYLTRLKKYINRGINVLLPKDGKFLFNNDKICKILQDNTVNLEKNNYDFINNGSSVIDLNNFIRLKHHIIDFKNL